MHLLPRMRGRETIGKPESQPQSGGERFEQLALAPLTIEADLRRHGDEMGRRPAKLLRVGAVGFDSQP